MWIIQHTLWYKNNMIKSVIGTNRKPISIHVVNSSFCFTIFFYDHLPSSALNRSHIREENETSYQHNVNACRKEKAVSRALLRMSHPFQLKMFIHNKYFVHYHIVSLF